MCGAIGFEGWLQLGKTLSCGPSPDTIVLRNCLSVDHDWNDFAYEFALLLRCFGFILRMSSELILSCSRYLISIEVERR